MRTTVKFFSGGEVKKSEKNLVIIETIPKSRCRLQTQFIRNKGKVPHSSIFGQETIIVWYIQKKNISLTFYPHYIITIKFIKIQKTPKSRK